VPERLTRRVEAEYRHLGQRSEVETRTINAHDEEQLATSTELVVARTRMLRSSRDERKQH